MVDFGTWIERDARKDVAVLLAARAAARAVPYLAGMKPKLPFPDDRVGGIISSMKSILLAMSVEFLLADEDRPKILGIVSANKGSNFDEVTLAGRLAHQSAWFSLLSLQGALREDTTIWHTSKMAFASACGALTDDGKIQASSASDIFSLENGHSSRELLQGPLWYDNEAECASYNWITIKEVLLAEDQQNETWIGWYESVRDGKNWGFNTGVSTEGSFYCHPTS